MFTLNFLHRCWGKRMYLLIVIVLLDIFSIYYSAENQHVLIRHMFVSYDLVSGFSNILYWIVLFIPIGNDAIQEKSTFGVSLFCRISKEKYVLKKSIAIFNYCVLFFVLSMMVSFVISLICGYEIGLFLVIIKLYIILVSLSFFAMVFVCFVVWTSNSSYIMTTLYIGLVTTMQLSPLRYKISINNLVENMFQSIIAIAFFVIVMLIALMHVLKKKDYIGMKKGMSI